MRNNQSRKSVWENPGPDEGWAWMVVFGLFITGYTGYGAYGCLGIIYPVFMNTMQLSPDEASWPFFVSFVTSTLTGILVPLLSRFYSIRQILFGSKMILIVGSVICFFSPKSLFILLFFFGIPVGILSGSFMQSTLLILGPYFQELKARAQSLSLTGGPLAMITFTLLIQYFTEIFEYRAVVLLIGAAVAQTLPATLLLRPRNEKQFHSKYLRTPTKECLMKKEESESSKNKLSVEDGDLKQEKVLSLNTGIEIKDGESRNVGLSDGDSGPPSAEIKRPKLGDLFCDLSIILGKRETYFVVIPDAAMMLAFYETFLISIDHGYRNGISKNILTAHFITFGTVAFFSRIVVAIFADRKYVNQFHLIKASILLKITTCLIYSFRTTPVTFLLNSVLIPMSISGYNCIRLTYITKFFEVKDIAMILTLSNLLISIGGILSPVLIGISMSLTGDYRAMWGFIAALLAFSLLLMILEPFVIRKRQTNSMAVNMKN